MNYKLLTILKKQKMYKHTVIQLKSGEEFIYPTVMDINPEYYDDIISLKCHYQNISILPYLKNLEILNCSNNNLEYRIYSFLS